ncbi:hypothetical protein GPALN_005786 [Globodera pallida]|nr:hypothetical protein GPALN_005786 [Globodera pallida]
MTALPGHGRLSVAFDTERSIFDFTLKRSHSNGGTQTAPHSNGDTQTATLKRPHSNVPHRALPAVARASLTRTPVRGWEAQSNWRGSERKKKKKRVREEVQRKKDGENEAEIGGW